MRFLVLVAAALGAASPASAQFDDRGEAPRYDRQIEWRLDTIYDRIERARAMRRVSEAEARRLHRIGQGIFDRYRYLARDGIDPWEYDALSRRIWELRQRIRWELRDRYDDRDWRDGLDDDRDWNDDSRWRGDWDGRGDDDGREGREDERDQRRNDDRWLERDDESRWTGPEGDQRRWDGGARPRGDVDPDDIFDDEDWDERRREDDDWYRVPDTR